MESWFQMIVSIIIAIFASNGFWSFLQSKTGKANLQTQVLIGLAHDRIVSLGLKYIERGYITHDEYENLYTYLYLPYKELGGNGTAKKVVDDVMKLPIKPGIED